MYDLSQVLSRLLKKKFILISDSVGRIDDVVIHSSGEKTVPARIEDIVMSSK